VKNILAILALSILICCGKYNKKYSYIPNSNNEYSADTFNVHLTTINDISKEIRGNRKQILIKKNENDTISFKYFTEDMSRHKEYKFLKKDFQLVSFSGLVIVDTLILKLKDNYHLMYKYEVGTPPIDGDGCFLFSPEYGLIAYASYSWLNKTTVVIENKEEFFRELIDTLLNGKINYLKPHNPQLIPPPPPPRPSLD
jgi:hypothetical protein